MMQFFTLTNKQHMHVTLCNWGARVTSILMPTINGMQEMLASYAEPDNYQHDEFYLGALCGRVCNRIANSQFAIDDKTYRLPSNDNTHCLHGGIENFAKQFWQLKQQSNSSVTLTLISKDGDQGFPGTVKLTVQYTLTDENELNIQFTASTDKATPINLTNHCYFNLGEPDCQNLSLQINANHYLEKFSDGIPTGKLLAVSNSEFDFLSAKSINEQRNLTEFQSFFASDDYDHCFVLAQNSDYQASLVSHQNQVLMLVKTDQPALQFYSGRYLAGEFKPHQGLCLEAQNYTDAINHAHFPNSILQPEQQYSRFVSYCFSQL